MARRRMIIRRIDPFSVLKFGAVAHLALAAVGFVALSIVLRAVLGSGIVDQVCEIAADVGFLECGVDQGGLTRLLALLAVVWAFVQTALVVLLAFLHNLIADLTGGIAVTMDVETPGGARRGGPGEQGPRGPQDPGGPETGRAGPPTVTGTPGPAGPNDQTTVVGPVDAIEAVVQPKPRRRATKEGGEGSGSLFGGRG